MSEVRDPAIKLFGKTIGMTQQETNCVYLHDDHTTSSPLSIDDDKVNLFTKLFINISWVNKNGIWVTNFSYKVWIIKFETLSLIYLFDHTIWSNF